MGQTSDFIRGGHGVAFNNGLHGPRVDKRRERIVYQDGIRTARAHTCKNGRLEYEHVTM